MPEQAYAVGLHEIGHMFGVPHVIGAGEGGITGFVVLPQGYDATNFVMYPAAVGKHAQKTCQQALNMPQTTKGNLSRR